MAAGAGEDEVDAPVTTIGPARHTTKSLASIIDKLGSKHLRLRRIRGLEVVRASFSPEVLEILQLPRLQTIDPSLTSLTTTLTLLSLPSLTTLPTSLHLQTLSIASTPALTTLPPLPVAERIDVEDAHLLSSPPPLPPTLTTLSLVRCGLHGAISLCHCPILTHIDLSGNSIESISMQDGFGAVEVLLLQRNALKSLPEFPPSLKRLDVSDNISLCELKAETIASCTNLTSLSLRRCNLNDLPMDTLQDLVCLDELHIDGNPLRERRTDVFMMPVEEQAARRAGELGRRARGDHRGAIAGLFDVEEDVPHRATGPIRIHEAEVKEELEKTKPRGEESSVGGLFSPIKVGKRLGMGDL